MSYLHPEGPPNATGYLPPHPHEHHYEPERHPLFETGDNNDIVPPRPMDSPRRGYGKKLVLVIPVNATILDEKDCDPGYTHRYFLT